MKPPESPPTPVITESADNQAELRRDIALLEQIIKEGKKTRAELIKANESKDEKKAQELTLKLKAILSQGKVLKRKLEGEPDSTLTVDYQYQGKEGSKVAETFKEFKETIELDIEQSLENYQSFYEAHGIKLPDHFADDVRELWQTNRESIEQAIQEKGFNHLLLIPDSLPNLTELDKVMTKDYEKEKGNQTYWWVRADKIEPEASQTRIILCHNAPDLTAHPALLETLDKQYGGDKENTKNNKAEDFIKAGESFSLEDYLVLQRKLYDESGGKLHLENKKTPDNQWVIWTWLPGSKVSQEGGGFRVVDADWDPGYGQLYVVASDADSSFPNLGCRLSRCFKKSPPAGEAG